MRRLPIILIVTAMFATACGGGGNSLLSASSSNWCDFAQSVEDSNDTLDEPTAAGMREFADQVKASVSAAPAEIKADVELLAEFANNLSTALDDNDDNIFLAFDALGSELTDPKYEDAGNRVSAYNERECGIVDTSSSDSPSADPDPFDSGSSDTDPFDVAPPPADDFGGTDLGGDPAGVDGLIAGIAEQMGVTEDQARCLFTALDFAGTETPPIGELMSAFTDCGIDPLTLGG